jgi:hypothetical protein
MPGDAHSPYSLQGYHVDVCRHNVTLVTPSNMPDSCPVSIRAGRVGHAKRRWVRQSRWYTLSFGCVLTLSKPLLLSHCRNARSYLKAKDAMAGFLSLLVIGRVCGRLAWPATWSPSQCQGPLQYQPILRASPTCSVICFVRYL